MAASLYGPRMSAAVAELFVSSPLASACFGMFRGKLSGLVRLGILLLTFVSTCAAGAASGESTYASRAREVMEHIEKTFGKADSALYSKLTTDPSPEDMWGNGVMFSALVGAARHEPEKYTPVMHKFFAAMDAFWDTKVKVPGYEPLPTTGGGNDKYYDDNAWMVITFLEAYELTRDSRYLTRAEQTLDFVLSGWDNEGGGGIWWHEGHKEGTKNTCANAPAAVSCLRLAKYRDPQAAERLTAKAQEIVDWTVKTFQDEDGLYWDSKNIATGHINRAKLTYNSALMLRSFLGLHHRTGKSDYLVEAQRIGKAADAFMGRRRWTVYRNHVKWSHLMVEADLELHRTTKEDYLLTRAKQNADFHYDRWKTNPPTDLIANASIARQLWLMADTETDIGRKFWEKADKITEVK